MTRLTDKENMPEFAKTDRNQGRCPDQIKDFCERSHHFRIGDPFSETAMNDLHDLLPVCIILQVRPFVCCLLRNRSQRSFQPNSHPKPGQTKPHHKVNHSSQIIPYAFLTSLPYILEISILAFLSVYIKRSHIKAIYNNLHIHVQRKSTKQQACKSCRRTERFQGFHPITIRSGLSK